MDRRELLQSSFGAFFAALLPWKKAEATKLPMSNWMGMPCAQLPDITVPRLSQDALASAFNVIHARKYSVASAFLNKWDFVRMEEYWDIDRETHSELHHVGIHGYLWGMTLNSTIMVPRGTIYFLSEFYEHDEQEYPALLQKLVIENPYDFVPTKKDGYVYRQERKSHYGPFGRITRYRDGDHEFSFDRGITWS